jgi:hypothetical protein
MAIEQEDLNLVKSSLWPDEVVEITVRQRRVGPGGAVITPTSVVATNKRLLIVNKIREGHNILISIRKGRRIRYRQGLPQEHWKAGRRD